MAFTPDLPFPKSAGDPLRSKDWNDLVNETKRLDTAKVERAGDAITGALSVAGALAIGKSSAAATAKLDVAGPLRINDNNLYLRGSNDANHGLGWFGTGKLFAGANVDGPVLFGAAGGALGTTKGGQKAALSWNSEGDLLWGNNSALVADQGGSIELGGDGSTSGVGSPYIDFHFSGKKEDFNARIVNDLDGQLALLAKTLSLRGNVVVVGGRLTAPNLFAGSPFRIGAGKTPAGSTAWQVYTANGIFVDVDTSAAQFSSTPVYVTSLHGASGHWATTGGTSVYSASPSGFRIYVKWSDANALTPATANASQWHIQWIGIEI